MNNLLLEMEASMFKLQEMCEFMSHKRVMEEELAAIA
jgi:hypothetical protein